MYRLRARLSLPLLLIMLAALLAPATLLLGAPAPALAQEKTYHMERYDTVINVNTDGSLDVQEVLAYSFTSGSFRRGLREIVLEKTEGITDVRVEEEQAGFFVPYQQSGFVDDDDRQGGRAGTFGTEQTNGLLRVRWIFGETRNSTRTFRVSYHVNGAIRVYDNRDELDWFGVPQDWDAPIYSSRVEAVFPEGASTEEWKTAQLPSIAGVQKYDNKIVWTANSGLSGGFEVGAQIPKGVLSASKPGWQQRIDEDEIRRAEDERRQAEYNRNVRPLVELGMLLFGVLLTIGGVLWNIRTWYARGRDKPVKLPIDYLADPPSNLPPGLVGTLLDETADVRDVIATIVDMGKKGNLTIAEQQSAGFLGFGGSKDFQYTQTGGNTQYGFEQKVLNALFKRGQTVQLSDLKNSFYTSLPPIYSDMYKELVRLKYFPESPTSVRSRNVGIGVGVIMLGGLVGFLWLMFGEMFSNFLIVPALGLGIAGILRIAMASAMPRKTDMGAEEAEKWRAFKRYLESIQQYTQGNVQVAADKFQQYLPYAVAMNVDRQFISQFNSVPATAMPTWYIPYGWGPYYGPGTVGQGSAGGASGGMPGGGGGFDVGGAVQGMSNSIGSAIQGLSDSFSSMVTSASNILTSAPSSSGSSGGGGGWGGGGGSFGGGGGGGGGGGAD